VITKRRGITRTVFITKRYAIKIPSLRSYGNGFAGILWSMCRGILANQSEAEWWRHSHDPAMCPVLHSFFGGIVNVYPRCEPFTCTEEQELAMHSGEWIPVTTKFGRLPGDNKPENFGILDDTVVLLDYDMNWNGCPHDRSGRQVS
jgi:hypothetical protein